MATVELVATKLDLRGKLGIIEPDKDGYYTIPIGGLNTYNSAGEFYLLKGAQELFDASGILQRRVKSGNLHGELGHPDPHGLTNEQYMSRLARIVESNISVHYRRIWIDEDFGKKNPHLKNPGLAGIIAELRPSGAQGPQLEKALENRHENLNFSIRALTRNSFERGRVNRTLAVVYTWDQVHEPGISNANKWDSPVLEDINKRIVTPSMIQGLQMPAGIVATEDSRMMAEETRRVCSVIAQESIGTLPQIPNALYCNW